MGVTKKPYLNDHVLRAKLAKRMGHILWRTRMANRSFIYFSSNQFLGIIACKVGLVVLEPSMLGELADLFETSLEILPEFNFFPVFQILRIIQNKFSGVLLMVSVHAELLTVPFLEIFNKFQNPFHHPIATTVFLIGTAIALWLGIGATLPIDKSLTLGLF